MRSIVGIALFLLGLGLVSYRLESTSADAPSSAANVAWVRTVDGWERSDDWLPTADSRPGLHPLVVASSQVLLSVFALAAFGTEPRRGR